MKEFILMLVVCSSVESKCLPPIVYNDVFKDGYDCMVKGYKESLFHIEQLGSQSVNENGIYVKFHCQENKIIIPKKKPVGHNV